MSRNYYSERTGNITVRFISYATLARKKLRYICYDMGLGWNIFEDLYTREKFVLTDEQLFARR